MNDKVCIHFSSIMSCLKLQITNSLDINSIHATLQYTSIPCDRIVCVPLTPTGTFNRPQKVLQDVINMKQQYYIQSDTTLHKTSEVLLGNTHPPTLLP